MDAATLSELKSKHGTLFEYSPGGHTVLFRQANRQDYKRFKAEALDEKKKLIATENLCSACLVYPDRPAYESVLDRFPTLADKAAADLMEALGGAEQLEKKVL